MSHANKNGVKVFYNTTGSYYENLNLDIDINKWIVDNGVDLLNLSLSTGRLYYIPGRQVVHFDIYATATFKFPSSYVDPVPPINLVSSELEKYKDSYGKFKLSWAQPSYLTHQKKIEFYLVYQKEDSEPADKWRIVGKTTSPYFIIDELAANKMYNFKVSAIDVLAVESVESSPINVIIT